MSGGQYDYAQTKLFCELMPYNAKLDYGIYKESDEYKCSIRAVRKANPMDDRIVSELVYDVLCIIHSNDWYMSGDTDYNTYRKDLNFFKKKWLKGLDKEYFKQLVVDEVDNLKQDLLKDLDYAE